MKNTPSPMQTDNQRPARSATRVPGVAGATAPNRAPSIMNAIMNTTAATTTQLIANPFAAPTFELVRMLPGPITTQAVINPGPRDWYQWRFGAREGVGSLIGCREQDRVETERLHYTRDGKRIHGTTEGGLEQKATRETKASAAVRFTRLKCGVRIVDHGFCYPESHTSESRRC